MDRSQSDLVGSVQAHQIQVYTARAETRVLTNVDDAAETSAQKTFWVNRGPSNAGASLLARGLVGADRCIAALAGPYSITEEGILEVESAPHSVPADATLKANNY
jgi:hypothetical protein